MAVLIDSYSESNKNIYTTVYDGDTQYVGQSFTNTNSITLDSCKFYLCKLLNPTGNCYAQVYAHTGTYGSTGKPTSSALATSDAVDVSTVSDNPTFALVTFNFSGANRITLNASTYYVLVLNYSGGSVLNQLQSGADSTSPSASGNYSDSVNGSTWNGYSDYDMCFYVYGIASTEYNSAYSAIPISATIPATTSTYKSEWITSHTPLSINATIPSITATNISEWVASISAIAVKVVIGTITLAYRGWNFLTKNSSSYTAQAKNTSTYTSQSKNTSTYTNQTKNSSSWTNKDKTSSSWTFKDKS